ncbi:MAG: cellulose binding domain-containing protein [Bacteroidetes bacterium]|nr:cellulose binding domain-containing protein [Bacteroidota bacterium]MDA1332600.1 cellulose binding domain-containing protein [Bacteroidota bacterium]
MRRFLVAIPFILLLAASVLETAAQNVRIVYTVDTVHEGEYTSHVMLTNMTDIAIEGWDMSFRLNQHVTTIEHAAWSEFQDVFTVQGQGWTRTIGPGEVVWFTITGIAYDGQSPEVPRSCFFKGAACTVEVHPDAEEDFAFESEMIVSAWVDDYDFTTYRGFIVVQNPTDRRFPAAWGLQFATPSQIVEMEGVVWSRSGTEYQLYGTAHTDYIEPHDFVVIPFRGVHTGTPTEPVNCRLNGTSCTFEQPDHLVETPNLNVFFKMGEANDTEWEGYIRIENPTKSTLSSWVLRFTLPNRITDAENMILERTGTSYTIRPDFGRGRIIPEAEYTFAIRGTWADSLSAPTNCTINRMECKLKYQIQQDVSSDGDGSTDSGTGGGGDDGGGDDGGSTGGGDPTVTCGNPGTGATLLPDLNFRFISVQPTSYVAFLDIANVGGTAIVDWTLEFSLVEGMTINNIWPANWELIGGNYRVTGTDANRCILPGETIRLNVQGGKNANFGDPNGCNFGGKICIMQRMASVANEDWSDLLPDAPVLHPAWPNPFNPQSRIAFDVGRSQHVRVELWDALGRKQQVLYDGFSQGGVSQSVTIDGGQLASEIYFVRLIPENGVMTSQSVILQK